MHPPPPPPAPPPPLAPGAPGRARLEAMVKLVHDVTGRALNDIRTDLAHTRDAQTTIVRIMEGEFLKGTARDPGAGPGAGPRGGSASRGGWTGVDMGMGIMDMDMDMHQQPAVYRSGTVQMLDAHSPPPPPPPPVVPNWTWRERESERETESRSPEKKKNAPMQVIDLCDSEDEPPPPPPAPAPPAPPVPPLLMPQPRRAAQPPPASWRRSPAADQAVSTRWTHTRRGEPRAPPLLPLHSAPFEPPRHRGPAAAENSSAAPASSSGSGSGSNNAWTTPARARLPPPPPPPPPPPLRHGDARGWGRDGSAIAPPQQQQPPPPPVRHNVPAAPPSPPPPQPDFGASSPLFHYRSSSTPPPFLYQSSPSPPALSSPEPPKPGPKSKPKPRVVTRANFGVDLPPAAPAAPLASPGRPKPKPRPRPRVVARRADRSPASPTAAPAPKTPAAGKRQKLNVITIDSDSGPDPNPSPNPDAGGRPAPAPDSVPNTDSLPRRARRRDRRSSPQALSAATRSLLQEFEDEARAGGDDGDYDDNDDNDDDDGELVVGAGGGSAGKKRKKGAPAKRAKTKAAPTKRKTKPPAEAPEEVPAADADAAEEEEAEEVGGKANDDDGAAEAQPAATKKRARLTDAEKARRAAAREAARAQRQQERDTKAAAREAVKARKWRERDEQERARRQEQELALADRLRLSGRDSALEMIVDVSQHLKDSAAGMSLARFLAGVGCEVNTAWYPALPGGGGEGEGEGEGAVGGWEWRVVKWRRKVTAEWDEGRGLFVPLPAMRVADEHHLLVYLTAQEFWQLVEGVGGGGGGLGLAEHVQLVRGFLPGTQEVKMLYLLEGVEVFMRKNRKNRNREYQNRVRAALGEGASIPADAEVLDEGVLQDALLELQLVHGCLVHHTASGIESAEWISRFTTDISTIPYKNSRSSIGAAGFCADAGQLRVGIGRADTFRRMLEGMDRVTPSTSEAVVRVYPHVRALVAAFESAGEEALAALPILTTRGGRITDKTVGPAVSRRICGVFMDADPDSVEI